MRMGYLVVVAPGLPRPVVVPVESSVSEEPTSEAQEVSVREMPGADGVSQGTARVEVDGVGPPSR
jgi:hypothetical protein